jgi:hypothetical protein
MKQTKIQRPCSHVLITIQVSGPGMNMKNGVFWDVTLRRLLVTASVVPSSPILVTLMKEGLSSSETSVLTRATRCNIPEDTILHSHRHRNLKSYMPIQLLKLIKRKSILQYLSSSRFLTFQNPQHHLSPLHSVQTTSEPRQLSAQWHVGDLSWVVSSTWCQGQSEWNYTSTLTIYL